MKTIKLFSAIAIIAIVLTSCSKNEDLVEQDQPQNALQEFIIKRDDSGSYSIDFNVNKGTNVDKVLDVETNTNKFYLKSDNSNKTNTNFSQELAIQGESLKVDFLDADNEDAPNFVIFDDSKDLLNKKSDEKLESYSITNNGDDTYLLEFTVKDGVRADFVYNEKTNVHEIHLKPGKNSTKKYKRILIKEEKRYLNFAFINNDLSIFNKSSEEYGKPRGKIGHDDDDF